MSRGQVLQGTIALTDSRARILGFDGLRAIAFLLVFVSHKSPWQVTECYGAAGVWMFFVLSGFLITRILATSRREIEAGRSQIFPALVNFYVRRTLRIFPIYYLFLAVMAALAAAGLMDLGGRYRQLADWLFLSNVYIEVYQQWGHLGHLWSLAVEEQFYLLFAPIALVLLSRRMLSICAGLIGISLLAHLGLFAAGAGRIHFDANSLVNFGLLGLGGLAGLRADRPLPKALRGDLAIVVALAAFLVVPALLSMDVYLRFGRPSAIFIACLLVQAYQNQNGRAIALLNSGPFRRLGVISYGAYLIHVVIDCRAALRAAGFSGPAVEIAGVLLDLVLTIVLATLSWRYYERPIRALAGRISVPTTTSAGPS